MDTAQQQWHAVRKSNCSFIDSLSTGKNKQTTKKPRVCSTWIRSLHNWKRCDKYWWSIRHVCKKERYHHNHTKMLYFNTNSQTDLFQKDHYEWTIFPSDLDEILKKILTSVNTSKSFLPSVLFLPICYVKKWEGDLTVW